MANYRIVIDADHHDNVMVNVVMQILGQILRVTGFTDIETTVDKFD